MEPPAHVVTENVIQDSKRFSPSGNHMPAMGGTNVVRTDYHV
jgi:hypothetical protein